MRDIGKQTTKEVLLDPYEMAVRLAEAMTGTGRPPGLTAQAALASMRERERIGYQKGASAMVKYVRERWNVGTASS